MTDWARVNKSKTNNWRKSQCYFEDDIFILGTNNGTSWNLCYNTNKQQLTFKLTMLPISILILNLKHWQGSTKTELMEKNGHLSQNSELYILLVIEDHIKPAEPVSLLIHPRGRVCCLLEAVSGLHWPVWWHRPCGCGRVWLGLREVALQHRVPLWTQGSWRREIRRTEQKHLRTKWTSFTSASMSTVSCCL